MTMFDDDRRESAVRVFRVALGPVGERGHVYTRDEAFAKIDEAWPRHLEMLSARQIGMHDDERIDFLECTCCVPYAPWGHYRWQRNAAVVDVADGMPDWIVESFAHRGWKDVLDITHGHIIWIVERDTMWRS